MKCAVVYAILNRIGLPRYVGVTTRSVVKREREHLAAMTPLGVWMRANAYTVVELQRCNLFLGHFYERKWIARYAKAGHRLLNRYSRPEGKVAVCGVCDLPADDPAVAACTHTGCGLVEKRAV